MAARPSLTPYSYRDSVAQSWSANEPNAETFRFKAHFRHSGTSISAFRSGTIHLSEAGIHIEGRVVPCPPIYMGVLLTICLIVALKLTAFDVFWHIIFSLIYFCLLAGCELIHIHRTLDLSWENLHKIVCVPKKRLVCLIYESVDAGAEVRSLTFSQNSLLYDQFIGTVNKYADGKAREGKLHEETSPLVAVLVVLFTVLFMLGLFFWFFGW